MKILTCDDHELFRYALRRVVEELPGPPELLEAETAIEALELAASHDLDLVMLDLGLPDIDGIEVLRRLRSECPLVAVVVVSGNEDPQTARAAIAAGAVGFIPKSSRRAVLRSALELVIAGGVYLPPDLAERAAAASDADERRRSALGGLTPRQLEVLELLAKGLTNKEIAEVLGIATGTVKIHVTSILESLEVTNRTEAAVLLRDLGGDAPA